MKAIFKETVIAISNDTISLEGNEYFPHKSLQGEYFLPSERSTTCPHKGIASYYHVKVGEEILENGAWTYKDPKSGYENIKDHVAFYPQVSVG